MRETNLLLSSCKVAASRLPNTPCMFLSQRDSQSVPGSILGEYVCSCDASIVYAYLHVAGYMYNKEMVYDTRFVNIDLIAHTRATNTESNVSATCFSAWTSPKSPRRIIHGKDLAAAENGEMFLEEETWPDERRRELAIELDSSEWSSWPHICEEAVSRRVILANV